MIIIDETLDNPKTSYSSITNPDGTLNSKIDMNRLYPTYDENVNNTSTEKNINDSNNTVLSEQQSAEQIQPLEIKKGRPFDIAKVILLTLIWSGFVILIGAIVALVIMVCYVNFHSYTFSPADYGVVYALIVYGYTVFFFSLIGELIRRHLEKKKEMNSTDNTKPETQNPETASINQNAQ